MVAHIYNPSAKDRSRGILGAAGLGGNLELKTACVMWKCGAKPGYSEREQIRRKGRTKAVQRAEVNELFWVVASAGELWGPLCLGYFILFICLRSHGSGIWHLGCNISYMTQNTLITWCYPCFWMSGSEKQVSSWTTPTIMDQAMYLKVHEAQTTGWARLF